MNGNIEDVSKLGQQIQEKTFSVKMPEIIKTHNDGAILRFGQLALQRGKGIWHRKAFIPWQDVKGVDLSEGYIKIQKHGKWLPWRKIAAASVPNLLVFLAVVQQPQAFTVR